MKRELIIFISLLALLSLIMHFDVWVSTPIQHLEHLPDSGAYGFGSLHPIIFTAVVYVVVSLFRGVAKLLKRLKGIKKGN